MKLFTYPPTPVSVEIPALSYSIDGTSVPVEVDTNDPENTTALPSQMYIMKDGNYLPITKDTATPSQTVAMPVEIVGTSGSTINITAGDIDVHLTDLGANADATKIGDGSGNYMAINGDDEALVHDEASALLLEAIEAKTPALVSGKVPVDTGMTQALTDAQLRATAVPVSNIQLPATLGQKAAVSSLSVVLASGSNGIATEAKQDAEAVLVGSLTETMPSNDSDSSGLNGRLQRVAWRLMVLSNQLPSSVGQKISASSLPVVLSSDHGAIPVQSAVQAGTITSAKITVGLTAVRATVAGTAPSASRKKLMIKPYKENSGSIYIGSSAVSISNGLEIIGPDRMEFELDSGDYYLISDTAGQFVEIMEKV